MNVELSDFIFYLFSILFLLLSYQLNKTSLAIQRRDCIIFLNSNAKMLVFAKWSRLSRIHFKSSCLKLVTSESTIVIHPPENYRSLLRFVCRANLLYQHQPPLIHLSKTPSVLLTRLVPRFLLKKIGN